ncbi:hypothetical protein VNO77_44274 [Canavalia gladiata]|uniref:Uncharacterized protein n=1 Tax=Canavalia gladiata TaxID=3824 RepID=A0AAN9JWE6_CANGL
MLGVLDLAVNLDLKALTTSSFTAADTLSPEFRWRAILGSPQWRHSSGAFIGNPSQHPLFVVSFSVFISKPFSVFSILL